MNELPLCPECKQPVKHIIKINKHKTLFHHFDNRACVSKHRFPFYKMKYKDIVFTEGSEKK